MDIRSAEVRDIPEILELLRQVGRVHHEGRPDIFLHNAQKYDAAQVKSLLGNPHMPIFVAVEERVLGYCFCQMKIYDGDTVIADHKELYIDDLCVHENCRGQRVGRGLFDYARAYAKDQGCSAVTLNVWCCNPSAMGFYEKLGMKPQKIGMEMLLEDA